LYLAIEANNKMPSKQSAGVRLREALAAENPLQIAGAVNAYCAMLAERAGFKAVYLSGAGVANASFGIPDLGMTTLTDVCEDIRRISSATSLPLLVDADTGFEDPGRCVREMASAGAAGCHIEDQIEAKRCGHRPHKTVVSKNEMVDRIKAAVGARADESFVVMARTDALAIEGLDAAVERAVAYAEAGADMIFPEAVTDLSQYKLFADAVKVPVLANITEFGLTQMYTLQQLKEASVRIVLYPLSAFRAMSQAALNVYKCIKDEGSQKSLLPLMQAREQLYEILNYNECEAKLDAAQEKVNGS
jgi:methylisocitrate lyase